jgi:hypothetical protein
MAMLKSEQPSFAACAAHCLAAALDFPDLNRTEPESGSN